MQFFSKGSPRTARGASKQLSTLKCQASIKQHNTCYEAPAPWGGGTGAGRPCGRQVQIAGGSSDAA